jgi:gamma-glutamylcyclotransferase (GGCT)/AIG2-like uncharacterized protein YtfP
MMPRREAVVVMARYFAYGKNMDTTAMATRCATPELLCVARLEGYRFVINGRGVATVVRDHASSVHGVLWALCADDLDALDRFEGVAVGHYRREMAAVVAATGGQQQAVIYVASDASPGPPRSGYLETVVAAASGHALPPDYLRALRGLLHPPQ